VGTFVFKQLRLDNFKGFASPNEIDMAPITLLYGENSAGKSAVMEALLLLSQSVDQPGPLEETLEPLKFSGKHIDLGSFHSAVNAHDSKRVIRLGASYSNYDETEDEESFDIEVSWNEGLKRTVLEKCVYKVSKLPENTILFERKKDNDDLEDISASDGQGLKIIAADISEAVKKKLPESEDLTSQILNMMLKTKYLNFSFLPGLRTLALEDSFLRQNTRPETSKDESYKKFEMELSHYQWRMHLGRRFASTRKVLAHIRYIGPLRKSPSRFERFVGKRIKYVGNAGEDVASILYKNEEILINVNNYLEAMGIPYVLKIHRIDNDPSGSMGELIAIQLFDKRNLVTLSLEDVGFGISQILPLLVQLAIISHDLIIVEQPELHLHPAVQANFADLLIEGIQRSTPSQYLLETHSEHIILRLQRRIREGILLPSDVVVYYVSSNELNGSVLHRLHLSETGDFVTPWPGGFFPERIDEMLG
jgi:predicted ATPase